MNTKTNINTFFIGKNASGIDKYVDLDASPHMIVTGATCTGKTNFIKHYLSVLQDRNDCLVYVIDPCDGLYDDVKPKNITYITEASKAGEIVDAVKKELQNRVLFEQNSKRKRIFLLFDEYGAFLDDIALTTSVDDIARSCKKQGIHLLLTTHRPFGIVFRRVLKDNVNLQIAFKEKGLAVIEGELIQTPLVKKQPPTPQNKQQPLSHMRMGY